MGAPEHNCAALMNPRPECVGCEAPFPSLGDGLLLGELPYLANVTDVPAFLGAPRAASGAALGQRQRGSTHHLPAPRALQGTPRAQAGARSQTSPSGACSSSGRATCVPLPPWPPTRAAPTATPASRATPAAPAGGASPRPTPGTPSPSSTTSSGPGSPSSRRASDAVRCRRLWVCLRVPGPLGR